MKVLLTVAMALLTTPALAQMQPPPESTPYAQIYSQMELVEGIGLELLETRVRAYPGKRGAELPEGIVYTVVTADGAIDFKADEQGMAPLPFRQDWVEAGYQITTNFPGEIYVSAGTFPKSLPNRIRYRDLMAFMPEFQQNGIASSKKWGGRQPHAVNGLMMSYRSIENPKVVIEAPWGKEVIEASEHGWIEMPVDFVLLAENPWVELPGNPDHFGGFGG